MPRFANWDRIIVGSCIVACASTAAVAGCYVCGIKCSWTGEPCASGSEVRICEQPHRNANEGEGGLTSHTETESLQQCWIMSSTDPEDWYQGSCDDPPSGLWNPIGQCGLDSGQCCWSKLDYEEDGTVEDGTFMIKTCYGIGCIGPTVIQ